MQRALAMGIVLVLLASSGASAEQAAGIKVSTNFDGLLGRQWIRTDPATIVGVGYVHPTQVHIGPPDGDFVAIGTANGLGVANCANDYDPLWTIYRDDVLGGIYHCVDIQLDVYAAGASPSFELRRASCSGSTKWVLWFAGIQRACLTSSYTYSNLLGVGIETTGGSTTDRNIDVKYFNLYKNYTFSTTWFAFENCDIPPSFANPNYAWDGTSNWACNVYLPPLD